MTLNLNADILRVRLASSAWISGFAVAVALNYSTAAAQNGTVGTSEITAVPGKTTALNQGIYSVDGDSCRFISRTVEIVTAPTQGTVTPRMVPLTIPDSVALGNKPHDCKGVTVKALQLIYRANKGAKGSDEVFIRTTADEPPHSVLSFRFLIKFP